MCNQSSDRDGQFRGSRHLTKDRLVAQSFQKPLRLWTPTLGPFLWFRKPLKQKAARKIEWVEGEIVSDQKMFFTICNAPLFVHGDRDILLDNEKVFVASRSAPLKVPKDYKYYSSHNLGLE
jgi:hypothetical protein